jgi:hypothetical protein
LNAISVVSSLLGFGGEEMGREKGGERTCQIPNKNLARSHLIKITHINTIPRKALCIENGRARMNKHPPIFLIEILNRLRFRI